MIKSARAVSEKFSGQSKYRKGRNTVCISRFRYRRVGGKDPLTAADDFIRASPRKEAHTLRYALPKNHTISR